MAVGPFSRRLDCFRRCRFCNDGKSIHGFADGGPAPFPKRGQMMVGHHAIRLCPPAGPKTWPMKNDPILSQIAEYCRQADMAETTFGRRAVNDGKLVHRLREGKRITIDTLDRIQAYIAAATPGGLPPPRGLEVPPEQRDPRD